MVAHINDCRVYKCSPFQFRDINLGEQRVRNKLRLYSISFANAQKFFFAL